MTTLHNFITNEKGDDIEVFSDDEEITLKINFLRSKDTKVNLDVTSAEILIVLLQQAIKNHVRGKEYERDND